MVEKSIIQRPRTFDANLPEPIDEFDKEGAAWITQLMEERRRHKQLTFAHRELNEKHGAVAAELAAEKRAHQDTREELARQRHLTDKWHDEAMFMRAGVAQAGNNFATLLSEPRHVDEVAELRAMKERAGSVSS